MGQAGDLVLVLDMLDDLQGLAAVAAAGAVGARDKIRFKGG